MRGLKFVLLAAVAICCLAVESQAALFGRRGGSCSSSGCSTGSGSQGCNIQRSAPISVVAPPVSAPVQQALTFAPPQQPVRFARVSRNAALSFCQPTPEQAVGRALIAFR